MLPSYLHVKLFHKSNGRQIFCKIEWDMANLWQFCYLHVCGNYGVYMAVMGCTWQLFFQCHIVTSHGGGGGGGGHSVYWVWVCAAHRTPIFTPKLRSKAYNFLRNTTKKISSKASTFSSQFRSEGCHSLRNCSRDLSCGNRPQISFIMRPFPARFA